MPLSNDQTRGNRLRERAGASGVDLDSEAPGPVPSDSMSPALAEADRDVFSAVPATVGVAMGVVASPAIECGISLADRTPVRPLDPVAGSNHVERERR